MPAPVEPQPGPVFVPLDFPTLPDGAMRARAAEFLAELRRRRTVREFSPRPVPRAVIEDCLRAAGTAPSGANLQPWHFAVLGSGDPARRRRLREAAEAEEREFYAHRAPPEWREALAPLGTDASKPFLETAPWVIAIFAAQHRDLPDGRRLPIYYPKESVGIATGFLIAALHHAGLATLTHTPSPMNFLQEIFGRPAAEKPFLLLVVGHPAEGAHVPAAALVKKSLAEIATFQ
ncbi:MAG: nitroreductase family protein [Opitutus sp.]|nr:nitroreductase family protein [Opitutus sp.]